MLLNTNNIPENSVLGINYSGMHDSSIALIDPDGKPIVCYSLERITRIKQDGRFPLKFIHDIPWEKISFVSLSVDEDAHNSAMLDLSKVHPLKLLKQLNYNVEHGKKFHQFLQTIPVPIRFVPHHISHAASGFWASGFDKALCLVYDGGMSNEHYFGGIYEGSIKKGIIPFDTFHAHIYANITQIYTAVTAILGFSPLKHEGKITGLAALGTPSMECKQLLLSWSSNPENLTGLLKWINIYGEEEVPQLIVDPDKAALLREECKEFSDETLASSVQELAEEHIIEILKNARSNGWVYDKICLAGGLFANVKINQKIAQLGFKQLFVAPAMSDDGTALGAAWYTLFQNKKLFKQIPIRNVYFGPKTEQNEIRNILEAKKIRYIKTETPAKQVAMQLSEGYVVALYQNECEFGPRALGNRSILAPANDSQINKKLNDRLSRTEFMPFAPVVRTEDADLCFENIENIKHACEFMTVTVDCTPLIHQDSPAVVHCDNTARPQIVYHEVNPLLHEILSEYKSITGHLCLVNTSFNVHEEPIVCSAEDAIKGFFESGLDYLCIGNVGIINLKENQSVEKKYLKQKIQRQANDQKNLKKELMRYSFSHIKLTPNLLYDSETLLCSYLKGFHTKEAWGTWSSGKKSRLKINTKEILATPVYMKVKFSMQIFTPLAQYSPVVKVNFSNNQVAYVLFRPNQERVNEIELNFIYDDVNSDIIFECTHEDSPLNHGSVDGRILSFGLIDFFAEIVETKEIVSNSEEILFWGAN